MSKTSKFNKDAALRAGAIGALATLLYNFLIPLTKGATFALGKLPITVSPFFSTILILWVLAGILAGIQAYGVPDWSRAVFRAFESLFFWVAPGLFIYIILFVGVSWNVPWVWANFVPLFDAGFWTIALAFGFYFSRKIMRGTGLKAAIDCYFGNTKEPGIRKVR